MHARGLHCYLDAPDPGKPHSPTLVLDASSHDPLFGLVITRGAAISDFRQSSPEFGNVSSKFDEHVPCRSARHHRRRNAAGSLLRKLSKIYYELAIKVLNPQ